MLAIFHKTIAHPPPELSSPDSSAACRTAPKHPEEILSEFHAAHPANCFSATFSRGAAIASVGSGGRLFCSLDEIYCMFVGSLANLNALIKQYGLCSRTTNEALLVIEAYRTLRDRGPYPADQVLKDFGGSFAFLLYDSKARTVFAALSSDGRIPLFWGIAADGSIVLCDESEVIKGSCGKSFAPFPAGCMFHSERGLRSYEHPMHKMKAMPRVDSEGVVCGANFKVDLFSRMNSMPRVGSAADWTSWEEEASS